VGNPAQGPAGEGIEHIEGRDVYHDAAGAEPADPLREVFAELEKVGIGQHGLDRGDQAVSLLEDGD
jgi:hypothetical protein